MHRLELRDGDCLLLCTDGLTDMVEDRVVADILGAGGGAERTCHRLVEEALAGGGKDNVTVVLARFEVTAPG